MKWDKKRDIVCINDLVVATLSRYTQDYNEEWMLIPIERPYIILRYIESGDYETLDGNKIYSSNLDPKTFTKDLYVSDSFLFFNVDRELRIIPLWKIKLWSSDLEQIKSQIELDKDQIRKLGF